MGNTLTECCRYDSATCGSDVPPPWLLPRGQNFLSKQDASIQTGTDLFDFLHQTSVPSSIIRAENSSSSEQTPRTDANNSMDRCFLFCRKDEVQLCHLVLYFGKRTLFDLKLFDSHSGLHGTVLALLEVLGQSCILGLRPAKLQVSTSKDGQLHLMIFSLSNSPAFSIQRRRAKNCRLFTGRWCSISL
jgi:hypothetical protein